MITNLNNQQQKEYDCPNCDEEKPGYRESCPDCDYDDKKFKQDENQQDKK